ncbi:hypothetical protein IAD21_00865 [Abditibacteriota bacterium]|nr:hypothetical protein IAD21_00865 [Abditibacteriota bacterium]
MPRFKLPSTLSVLYTLAILAAAWEFWTIVNRSPGDTFSATIRKLGKGQPFIVFMLGMLSGHLWWPLIDGEPQPSIG